MMEEYISRAKTLKVIKGSISEVFNIASNAGRMHQKITEIVESVPAADVAPVVHETPMLRYRPKRHEIYDEYGLNENGEMLYVKRTILDEKNYAMYCPACGKRLCSRFKNFCPNCGAKMDGGKA